jgi:membrane-bound metal-dependent hydrolase YbcI (DUF457 family)
MLIGHLAVGLASKRVAPRTSIGTLVAAAFLLDLLWPLFLLAGLERVRIDPGNTAVTPLDFEHYPWSHSLLMTLVWAALAALIYRARTRYSRGALWVGIAVASHWVLDFVTHRPDLPLVPGAALRVGLGLWNSRGATVVVEGALFIAGVAIYLATTRARDRIGAIALWGYLGLMTCFYVANLIGPPPPSADVLDKAAFVTWLFVPLVYWIDRHRALRVEGQVARAGAGADAASTSRGA